MLSLSMSFLLWSWTRSRGSWAIHRRGVVVAYSVLGTLA